MAELLNQGQYVFNIVDDEIVENKILNAIKNMVSSLETELENIAERVKAIQEDNCFDVKVRSLGCGTSNFEFNKD